MANILEEQVGTFSNCILYGSLCLFYSNLYKYENTEIIRWYYNLDFFLLTYEDCLLLESFMIADKGMLKISCCVEGICFNYKRSWIVRIIKIYQNQSGILKCFLILATLNSWSTTKYPEIQIILMNLNSPE